MMGHFSGMETRFLHTQWLKSGGFANFCVRSFQDTSIYTVPPAKMINRQVPPRLARGAQKCTRHVKTSLCNAPLFQGGLVPAKGLAPQMTVCKNQVRHPFHPFRIPSMIFLISLFLISPGCNELLFIIPVHSGCRSLAPAALGLQESFGATNLCRVCVKVSHCWWPSPKMRGAKSPAAAFLPSRVHMKPWPTFFGQRPRCGCCTRRPGKI
jgi:hypothetical protein